MRKALFMIVLSLGLTTAATEADAFAAWGQDLRYVGETTAPNLNGAGTASLCHLVDYATFMFVPVYTSVQGYALSSTACTGDMFRELTPQNLAALQAAGTVPADFPTLPMADLTSLVWGHAWLILAAVAIMWRALVAVIGKRSRNPKTPDALAIHALVAMSQVAIADGRIDDAEVHQISQILTRLTGTAYAPAQVMVMLQRLNPSAADLAHVGQDLSEADRQIVLEAALNIAVVGGDINPNEYEVVSDLAQRMRIGADQFRGAIARISEHLHTVQAA